MCVAALCSRPYVEIETVFTDGILSHKLASPWQMLTADVLHATWREVIGLANARPGSRWLRRSPAKRPDRRRGVGNTFEDNHGRVMGRDAGDLAALRRNHVLSVERVQVGQQEAAGNEARKRRP